MRDFEWYNREGEVVSRDEYFELSRDPEYRRVGIDRVGPYLVSTVLLGLDHSFTQGGPPLIFETMTCWQPTEEWLQMMGDEDEPEGKWGEGGVWRYSTLSEAERGHAVVVAEYQAGVDSLKKLWGSLGGGGDG